MMEQRDIMTEPEETVMEDIGIVRRIFLESRLIAAIKHDLEWLYGLRLELDKAGQPHITPIKQPDVRYGESPLLTIVRETERHNRR